ncbi:MAG: autoinducer binding domain-containing protein [Paracoccaceae bacterium]
MENKPTITSSLARLDEICTAGYAIALHIEFTTPRFLFQTYSKDWMEMYSEKGLVLKDPTVLWGFSNTGIARWHDLEEIDDSGVLALAQKYGLKYGFTYAIDDNSSKSISSFARGDCDFADAELNEISDIVAYLHKQTSEIDEFSPHELRQLKSISVNFTRG